MPMNIKNYPPNWKEISRRIRFERAKGKCEACLAPHGEIIFRNPARLEDWVMIIDGEYHLPSGKPLDDYGFEYSKSVKVILTVAHLDHDTRNNEDDNLMALCQLCHLRYDAQYHAQNAKRTRAKKYEERQPSLFREDK